jgi:hypothetical protein
MFSAQDQLVQVRQSTFRNCLKVFQKNTSIFQLHSQLRPQQTRHKRLWMKSLRREEKVSMDLLLVRDSLSLSMT